MKTNKAYLIILMSALSVLNAHSQLPSYLPSNGLVGYWPFNGNANDESGNGNNGIVNGATLTADRNGVANKAYDFNLNYILVNNNQLFNLKDEISINVWYQINNSVSQSTLNMCFVSKHQSGSTQSSYIVYNNNLCGPTVYLTDLNSQVHFLRDDSFCDTKDWHMLTMTFNNSGLKMYLDGVFKYEKLVSTRIKQTDLPLIFGGCNNSNQYNDIIGRMIGKLDDISIYNRVLSIQEITSLYKGCNDETATTNSLNGIILKNSQPINLTASPSLGGQFSGDAISNNKFTPANAHLGKNTVHYNFTNSTGCKDSTDFSVIVADTNTCSTYDTLKIKVKFTAGLYANTINTIKFYPNPTKEVLFIDNGNYQAMNGYSIKIISLAGTVVFNQPITSQQVQISMNQFATKGLYIAQIVDSNNAIVDSKKIVLE
jgi:hypothetical protein